MDKSFPQSEPRLYFKVPAEHAMISKVDQEVMYKNFYKWTSNSKITEILLESQKYFDKDSPFQR